MVSEVFQNVKHGSSRISLRRLLFWMNWGCISVFGDSASSIIVHILHCILRGMMNSIGNPCSGALWWWRTHWRWAEGRRVAAILLWDDRSQQQRDLIGWLIWSRQSADQQVGEEGVGQTELWASGSSTWLNTELHQRARWPVWVGSTEWLLSTYRFLKMGISRFRLCDFGWHEKLNAPKPFLRSSKCSLHRGFLATSTLQREVGEKSERDGVFFFFYQMALNWHKHCGLEHVGFINAEFR